jgi:hypothetical protein
VQPEVVVQLWDKRQDDGTATLVCNVRKHLQRKEMKTAKGILK